MSDEALAVREEVTESDLPSVHLVARNTGEMEQSRTKLLNWLAAKVRIENSELSDVRHAFEVAKENKWSAATLKRQVERCAERVLFYSKVLEAVTAGFTIVPNFPVDYFAVRVKRTVPRKQFAELTNAYEHQDAAGNIKNESPQILPVGEGRYVNPSQLVRRKSFKKSDDKGKETLTKQAWATAFGDIVFPIECARPEVMSATSEAMALNLFDAIGICPQNVRNADPLIIARIIAKRRGGYQEPKTVSFLLAWHLDLRTL